MRYGRHLLAATVGASLMFSGVAMGVTSIAPVARAQDVGAGTMAVVDVDFLNVRQSPSLSGAVVTTLAFSDEVDVVTGPVAADGYDWYRLQQDGAFIGWSVAGFLRAGEGEVSTPVVDWMYGDTVIVDTDFLNVRATPSTSAAVLDVYEFGFEAIITGDATSADGLVWYPIDNLGWVAGQYLSGSTDGGAEGSDDGGTTPAGGWVYGDGVIVNTDLLNVRVSPSITAAVLDVYEFGTEATVTGDAVTADGITWFPVDNLGWVAGQYLAGGGGTTDPGGGGGGGDGSGEFVYGNVVMVNTDLLNVRSLPTLSGDVLDVYPQGTEATITGDATPADGIVWYPVDNTGWVAGPYLTLVSGTPGTPSGSTAPSGSAAPSGSTAPAGSAAPSTSGSTSATPGGSARTSGSPSATPSGSARPSGSASAVPSGSARPSGSSSAAPSTSAQPSASAAPSAAPAVAAFADGDAVTVNAARLNIRAEASSTAEVLRTVDLGTELTISGDPVTVDGVDWYNVGTVDAEEWVVGEFLTATGG